MRQEAGPQSEDTTLTHFPASRSSTLIGMACNSTFHANPDVSGIGVSVVFGPSEAHRSPPLQIVITFYVQGALNLALFNYSRALKHFPSKQTKLKAWIDGLLQEFLFGSTAAGYALCIAAFTQLNSITAYHLFLCYTFSSAIFTVVPYQLNRLGGLIFSRQQEPSDRIIGLYFLGNQILLVAMNCVTIYHLNSFWDNKSGKCFIVFINGSGDPDERDDAVLWLYINLIWLVLGQLIPALVVWSGWSKQWAPQNPKVKSILIILFQRFSSAFFFIWELHWTIRLTIANQPLIDDNEYSFGFGQVGALVTLFLSLSRAHTSYTGARNIVWLGRSNADQFVIEYKRRRAANDNQMTLSVDENLVASSLPQPVTSREETSRTLTH
jgi:hypothetical protein